MDRLECIILRRIEKKLRVHLTEQSDPKLPPEEIDAYIEDAVEDVLEKLVNLAI